MNANQRCMSGAGEKEWKPSLAWIVFVSLLCFFLEHLKQRILAFFCCLIRLFSSFPCSSVGDVDTNTGTLARLARSLCLGVLP